MVYAVNKLTESDHLYRSDRIRTLYFFNGKPLLDSNSCLENPI